VSREKRTRLEFVRPGRTRPEFQGDSDINRMIERYRRTGVMPPPPGRPPVYGDFGSPVDFQTALNKVLAAEALFAAMPAKLRARVGNDPAQFLAWVADPANREEGEQLGLFEPSKKPADKPADPPPGGGAANPPAGGGGS